MKVIFQSSVWELGYILQAAFPVPRKVEPITYLFECTSSNFGCIEIEIAEPDTFIRLFVSLTFVTRFFFFAKAALAKQFERKLWTIGKSNRYTAFACGVVVQKLRIYY